MIAKKYRNLLSAVGVLITEFVICAYLTYNLFFNVEIPKYLLIFCLFFTSVVAICEKNRAVICTVVGYAVAFLMGVLCDAECVDSHGTTIATWYAWFITGTIGFVAVGVIWEVFKTAKEKVLRKEFNA